MDDTGSSIKCQNPDSHMQCNPRGHTHPALPGSPGSDEVDRLHTVCISKVSDIGLRIGSPHFKQHTTDMISLHESRGRDRPRVRYVNVLPRASSVYVLNRPGEWPWIGKVRIQISYSEFHFDGRTMRRITSHGHTCPIRKSFRYEKELWPARVNCQELG